MSMHTDQWTVHCWDKGNSICAQEVWWTGSGTLLCCLTALETEVVSSTVRLNNTYHLWGLAVAVDQTLVCTLCHHCLVKWAYFFQVGLWNNTLFSHICLCIWQLSSSSWVSVLKKSCFDIFTILTVTKCFKITDNRLKRLNVILNATSF